MAGVCVKAVRGVGRAQPHHHVLQQCILGRHHLDIVTLLEALRSSRNLERGI